jgi:hypothetical protein
MSSNPRAATQVTKAWNETALTSTWTGTTVTVELDGDRPVTSWGIDLSAAATVTFQEVIGATNHTILKNDGTALSIDMTTLTETFRFYPEFANSRKILVTATVSQVNGKITEYASS